MRCPKCQYISFGSANRCRNCGYDFSLSEDDDSLDLPIQNGSEPIGPLADLPLSAPPSKREGESRAAAPSASTGSPAFPGRTDLPLFPGVGSDDTPLVTPPAVPRAPLSVRRGPPIVTRQRQQGSFDADGLLPDSDPDSGGVLQAQGPVRSKRSVTPELEDEYPSANTGPRGHGAAPRLARVVAGILDVGILGTIDLAVVYLTLRLCGLELTEVMVLPKLPMVAFLLLLNGGYLVLFTAAGGQTIGKMATRIRVVPSAGAGADGARVPFGTAVVRAAAYLASLLPAGLGFLPILFSPDGRAIHDRLSDTRVVKA